MAIYENTAKQFMELNPDVTIKVETLPGTDELQQKVYSSVAAGTGPDMLKMSEFFFKMRDQDLLLEWPEDLFPNSWFTEMYPNVNWDAYGRYVVPTGSCGTLLVYNKKMFEEVGLDPTVPPATWDDFDSASQKLALKDSSGSLSRCGFVPAGEWPGLSQCYQQGGNIVKVEGDQQVATFDSPEMQAALQHLIDDQVHKLTSWDAAFPDNLESIGTGLAAMTEDQSWVLGEYKGSYADVYPDLAYAPNPTPSGEPDPVYGYKSTVLDISVLKGHEASYPATFESHVLPR
jgi:multiple sugar transport system substrate-binding protein